jgi:hypothetical protein
LTIACFICFTNKCAASNTIESRSGAFALWGVSSTPFPLNFLVHLHFNLVKYLPTIFEMITQKWLNVISSVFICSCFISNTRYQHILQWYENKYFDQQDSKILSQLQQSF